MKRKVLKRRFSRPLREEENKTKLISLRSFDACFDFAYDNQDEMPDYQLSEVFNYVPTLSKGEKAIIDLVFDSDSFNYDYIDELEWALLSYVGEANFCDGFRNYIEDMYPELVE